MVYGFDMSHWNTLSGLCKAIDKEENQFVFLKATEGASYVDGKINNYFKAVHNERPEMIIGFYHYARPGINTPESEAANFIKVVKSTRYYNPLLALDWEGDSLTWGNKEQRIDWIIRFSNQIKEAFGYMPLIYLPASACKDYGDLYYKQKMGLWVASWSRNPYKKVNTSPWPVSAFHQYTNYPYDMDVFNGTLENLNKFRGL